jgi:hypothetical protein
MGSIGGAASGRSELEGDESDEGVLGDEDRLRMVMTKSKPKHSHAPRMNNQALILRNEDVVPGNPVFSKPAV